MPTTVATWAMTFQEMVRLRGIYMFLIFMPLVISCSRTGFAPKEKNLIQGIGKSITNISPKSAQTNGSGGKNIILCLDGTNNEFGRTNTNVVRLFQCLDRSEMSGQIAYYDPGIGTLAPPGLFTSVGKSVGRTLDQAFAIGIFPQVEEAILFLMRTYKPGDRIYIFGFSRGAYTARAVAAFLFKNGLPDSYADNLIPYFTENLKNTTDWWESDQFKRTFGRDCPVHFLGLWDTVSSIGWIYNPKSLPYTKNNPEVSIVRHAISLDERRCYFRTNQWESPEPGSKQDVKEVWFAGVHCDVGGGYPEKDSDLWKISFEWMVRESAAAGIKFNQDQINKTLGQVPSPLGQEWFRGEAHKSLKGLLWLAELLPKLSWDYDSQRHYLYIPLGKHRKVPNGALLHSSVIERMLVRSDYRPKNLDESFVKYVLRHRSVPQLGAYRIEPDRYGR